MYKSKRKILITVIFLTSVFLAPLFVKSLHHHNHKNERFIHNEKGNKTLSPEKENCFICEFEFSLNDLPKDCIVEFHNYFFIEHRISGNEEIFLNNLFYKLSPRSPPPISIFC